MLVAFEHNASIKPTFRMSMSEKSLLSPHSISPGPFQRGVQHPEPSLNADMDIFNVPLREPSRSHDRELLPQLPHALRGVRNNDDRLLYS